MNMSYCRFENTARDLSDCLTALMELKNGESDHLSRSELDGAKSLVGDCLRVVELLVNDQLQNVSSGVPFTAEYLVDEVQSINDDVRENLKDCLGCGERFIASYEGQTVCGMAGHPACIDEEAPEFGSPID